MNLKMAVIMKENGRIIRFLGLVNFISQTMDYNTKEIGLMMNFMVLEFNMLKKEAIGFGMKVISKMV